MIIRLSDRKVGTTLKRACCWNITFTLRLTRSYIESANVYGY